MIKNGSGPLRASISSGVPGSIKRGCSSDLSMFTGVFLYRVREIAAVRDTVTRMRTPESGGVDHERS